jgi:formate-dependent nitrite reductase membrane component NrfD
MWSEQGQVPHQVTSGHPGGWNSSAAAVLAYDVPHRAPWDWRVSLYTWTKGVASGAYLVPLLLAALGLIPWTSPLWLWAAPMVAGAFLALTGLILIWDLEHPERFHYIFLKAQWKSWLVRGGFIIAAYSVVLLAHFLASLAGTNTAQRLIAWVAAPLAVATAVYTAYLFAQARARDMWQNPLAPAHLVIQAVLAGSSALALVAARVEPAFIPQLLIVLSVASALHLLLWGGEATLEQGTAHARLAAWEMTHGKYRAFFWVGIVLIALGFAAPWLGVWAAGAALLGVLAHEHAYVQAGQAVPLA